jgi:hypothetical protein
MNPAGMPFLTVTADSAASACKSDARAVFNDVCADVESLHPVVKPATAPATKTVVPTLRTKDNPMSPPLR